MPPKRNNERYYNWGFALVVILFLAYKFQDLTLPYFWDELGVYSQSATYQFYHRLSLMPNSVPPEFSRGHPLFYTFINAIVFRLFGCTPVPVHAFNQLIAVGVLTAVYVYTSRYFNRLAGLVSAAILAIQPVFLAQAGLVIPEMLLAFFVVLCIFCYYEERYALFGFFATLAILTKESGIVLPCYGLFYAVVSYFIFGKRGNAFKPLNLFFTVSPFIVYGLFLVIQKQQNGWYFFPYHMETMASSLHEVNEHFKGQFNFVFWAQGRYWWKNVVLAGVAAAIVSNRVQRQSIAESIIMPLGIYVTGFLVFSAINFYMERYVLQLVVLFAIVTGAAVVTIFNNKYWGAVAMVLLCLNALDNFIAPGFNYDTDLGYRPAVRCLEKAVEYVARESKGEHFCYGNFPAYFALSCKDAGYLKGKTVKLDDYNDTLEYAIHTEPGADFKIFPGWEILVHREVFVDTNTRTEVLVLKKVQRGP